MKLQTNLINIDEKAQYIRRQARPSQSSSTKQAMRNINAYQAEIKHEQSNKARNKYSNQKPGKNNFQGNMKRDF